MRVPVAFLAAWLLVAEAQTADRLVLRNLDFITDRTVTAVDEDGVVLDAAAPGGSNRLHWDEIERGKIALNQPRFDALLAELGPPLYRIRLRLKVGDYVGAGEFAEALFPRFADRKSQTAYMVCQATMWSRIAKGSREAAVEPYLRCYELLRSRAAASAALPGTRRLQTDVSSAVSPELIPIWLDAAAAKASLEPVQQVIRTFAQPRPIGAYVYYATLAVAAGETAEVDRVLPQIEGESSGIWSAFVAAEQELAANSPGAAIQQLRQRQNELPTALRTGRLFLLGLANTHSADEDVCRAGVLSLLTLPAVESDAQPELSAAALYHAALALDKLKDSGGAAALRRELASRHAGTKLGAKGR